MRTSGVGHERRTHHAPVGRGDVDGLARPEIAVLVGHLSVDGKRFIGGDGGRQRCDDEVNGCTGGDRDVLGSAHQAKARRDGCDTGCSGREQTVAADAAGGSRPGHGRCLNHGLMVVGHRVEVHRCVSVGGRCPRRTDGHAGDVRGVELNLRPEVDVGGRPGIERGMSVPGVGRGDDHPSLFVGDGHASGADIEPNPSRGVDVHHRGGNSITVVHTGLHAWCTPGATGGGAVPSGGGGAPVDVRDRVNTERNRCGTLNIGPRFDVHAEGRRVHLLVLGKRHLSGVQCHVDATLVRPKGSAVGSCAHGGFTGEVGVRVFAVNGRVLDVGVTESGDFASGLEHVCEGVVVVVGVVWLADGKAPARGRRSGDGLVHALDPPREKLALGQVVLKAEGGVRDF